MILPLVSVSSSWSVFAQGGGGALLLVLLKVDPSELYRDTMASLAYVPRISIYIVVPLFFQFDQCSHFYKKIFQDVLVVFHFHPCHQLTCAPPKLQVLKLLTLWETATGGGGACLFLGFSIGKVLEDEMLSEFIWSTACFLGPGEAGALTAPCYTSNVNAGHQ